ncbi:MAG TPA: hypothetical protein VMT71_13265 [Syntrophorhabdales bacterium]|nr:hypothetical protein [Syntrophorhabdales bacterium]
MKIKTDEPSRIITEQAGKRPKTHDANKFGKLLQRTMEFEKTQMRENASSETSAPKNVQAMRVDTVAGIGALAGASTVEQQGLILERVEQLLDTLEEYQRNLGNASTPAQSLQSLIGRMEEQNKSLAAVLVTLPDGDSLKDILNRVLITSVVEVEKFKRGDYS